MRAFPPHHRVTPRCGTQEMNRTNPKVDFYFENAEKWRMEFERLRSIILACPLIEDLKWGCPCYTFEDKNIILIHGFKDYCAVLFFKGALLKDAKGVLIQQTANVQAGRQIRFTNAQEITEMETILKTYIHEAMDIEKAGLKVNFRQNSELSFPEEFKNKLDADAALKTAFAALTPGRQRAYALYFSAPKQSKTRDSRVEKHIPRILQGKGLDD
jgi:uncharacterized protein YdeI (YjbR/CyaY-like superfamily)